MDQLNTSKNTPAPPGGNSQQGGRPRNQNWRENNGGASSYYPRTSELKFSGLDQDEFKGIVANGSKFVHHAKLYEGLKMVVGKKNSIVKTTLVNIMEALSERDFLPNMPSPSNYTVKGAKGNDAIDPDKKGLLEKLWVKKGERCTKKYDQYVEDLKALFSTAKGQLSPEDKQDTLNMLQLLTEYFYRDSATKVHPMVDAANKIFKFFSCKQDNNKSAATYAEEVKARFDVITLAGITIRSKDMIKLALKKGSPDKSYNDYTKMNEKNKLEVKTMMDEMLLSVVIVKGGNTKTHQNLSGVLTDNYSLGSDVYPASQPTALELMNQYKSAARATTGQGNSGATGQNSVCRGAGNSAKGDKGGDITDGTALVTKGVGTDPKISDPKMAGAHQILMSGVEDGAFNDKLCFMKLGHVMEARDDCSALDQQPPAQKPRSVALPTTTEHNVSCEVEFIFSQSNGNIDPYWILLGSQATCNCVSNPRLLKNIRTHPEGRKNILSLGLVSDSYRITLDTTITQSFFVHEPDGTTRRFDRAASGLYYCDLKETDGTILTITSIEGQNKLYSDLDDALEFPSMKDYLKIIDNNLLLNCPVTRRDIKIAKDIFGTNTHIIKGKAVHQQPTQIPEDVDPIPADILTATEMCLTVLTFSQ
eukprot:jgi/Psemu1/54460/gm1.54460_g